MNFLALYYDVQNKVDPIRPPRQINCTYANFTNPFRTQKSGGWEYIPRNILINLTFFLFLVLVFAVLREFALRAKYVEHLNWLQFIYGDKGPYMSTPKPKKSGIHNPRLSVHLRPSTFHKKKPGEEDTQSIRSVQLARSVKLKQAQPKEENSKMSIKAEKFQRGDIEQKEPEKKELSQKEPEQKQSKQADQKPEDSEPKVAKPEATEPATTEAKATESKTTEPKAIQIETTEPEVSEQPTTEPPATKPADVKSVVNEEKVVPPKPPDTSSGEIKSQISAARAGDENHPETASENQNEEKHQSFGYLVIAGFLKRVVSIIHLDDKEILQHRGFDAVQYLTFQRHIIYFLILLTLVCLFVILPINIEGNLKSEQEPYARTTINNIDRTSNLLWAHATTAWMLFPIGIYFMYKFSTSVGQQLDSMAHRTVLICHIHPDLAKKDNLLKWFQIRFPNVVIEAIQQVYDTSTLRNLRNRYSSLTSAIRYCEEYKRFYNEDFKVRPHFMGHAMWFCRWFEVDGLAYYRQKALETKEQLKYCFEKTVQHPIGTVFITFQTSEMAENVLKTLSETRTTSCSLPFCKIRTWLPWKWQLEQLELSRWQVSLAPNPEDVNWEEISSGLGGIWFRKVFINLLLVVLFFFLTTPPMVLVIFRIIFSEESWSNSVGFVSTFLLILAAQLLPAIVTLASSCLPYKTISQKNHSVMWKTFIFLLLMILILPSLGFNTAGEILAIVVQVGANTTSLTGSQSSIDWKCIFPVDDGSFFINYVLQSALIGNGLELLRIPEVLIYFYYTVFSNYSAAEFGYSQRQTMFDFYFGTRYARFLFIFCMVVSYSITCPLIAPCGLLYMCLKYMIDKYCVYYVYTPTKINSQIHSTAILFFHIAITMMQIQVLTHFYLTTGHSDITGMTVVGVIISIVFFIFHIVFNCFGYINQVSYSALFKIGKLDKMDFCACLYIPPLLMELDLGRNSTLVVQ